jgi:hypothetical protein
MLTPGGHVELCDGSPAHDSGALSLTDPRRDATLLTHRLSLSLFSGATVGHVRYNGLQTGQG